MPQFIPLIIPLLTGAAAATSAGLGVYNAVNGGGGPSQPAAPTPPTAAQNVATETKNRMDQALLIRQQEPGIQSQSPGVSPDYEANFAGQQAGINNPSADPLQILMSLLNNGSGGGGGQPTDLLSLAAGSTGGTIT